MLLLFLIVGVIGIIFSGIFIGAWTNGQQQRANFHSETEDHRDFRTKIALISGLAGLFRSCWINIFFVTKKDLEQNPLFLMKNQHYYLT